MVIEFDMIIMECCIAIIDSVPVVGFSRAKGSRVRVRKDTALTPKKA